MGRAFGALGCRRGMFCRRPRTVDLSRAPVGVGMHALPPVLAPARPYGDTCAASTRRDSRANRSVGELVRGRSVKFESRGEDDSVLLIHGAIVTDSSEPPMPQETLAGYRLMRYRRHMYGHREQPSGPPTIGEHARDIGRRMKRRGSSASRRSIIRNGHESSLVSCVVSEARSRAGARTGPTGRCRRTAPSAHSRDA